MIRLSKPELAPEDVRDDIDAIIASGTLTNGPYRARFEESVAELVGARFALATTSATTALHLALAAARIGPGDEVLVADFTFPATANVVIQAGATPVLVDIDLETFTMNLADMEAKRSARTRAVIPVDPFGAPAPLREIDAFCVAHELVLIEDAACALGASVSGRMCGSFGAAGCFSFHPRKSISTGEGGMLTTNDPDLASRAGLLRNHGGAPGPLYLEFVEAGFNYRMSEIQAAMGLAGLRRLTEIHAARGARAQRYLDALSGWDVLVPRAVDAGVHTYQSFVVLLPADVSRDGVIAALRARDVETTLGTYAVHAQPYFQTHYGYTPGDVPQSFEAFRRSLTLPLFATMTDEEQGVVIDALKDALGS